MTGGGGRRRRQPEQENESVRTRLGAGVVALTVGIALLVAKFFAYRLTGSLAVLSDAMESIVNVLAAAVALASLWVASRPADRSHPYGHGKVEFFSAAFEGGLISFAAVLILAGAVDGLLSGVTLRQLDLGLAITGAAGLVNLALGVFLVRIGRRHDSLVLVADGQHVIADFWTSVGVIGGLLLVQATGRSWIDPFVASLVGLHLGRTGWRILRQALGGLLDEEDQRLIHRLVKAMNRHRNDGIVQVHDLRAIRSGRFVHVDAEVVVPEFWPVTQAHEAVDRFEREISSSAGHHGEFVFHLEPCRQAWCSRCDLGDCSVRKTPFVSRLPWTAEEIVEPSPEPRQV